MSNSPLFLGLDLSTQQLKAIVISSDSSIAYESTISYDKDLPQYGTFNGAISGPAEGEVTSPVAMWLDALELLLVQLHASKIDLSRIVAISGAGQQHGSVYWSKIAGSMLASLDPSKSLSQQLSPAAFSLPNAPIWQDSSTTRECHEINDFSGGQQALADLTGSRAYERFTGPQIKRIRRLKPEAYQATARISLVSSFLATLFLGKFAPIEVSDASGMNLMEILTCKWNDQLLGACGGPELRQKLGPEPAPGGSVLGTVHSYWTARFGFSSDCIVAPFTGDNPSTMVALSTPGDAVLSLGTSTTLLLAIPPALEPPKRFTSSHLLAHPTTLDAQIAMLCYKNGALAREDIRNRYASGDWTRYNELVESIVSGNDEFMGFYFPLPEIIPPNVNGEFFFRTGESITRIDIDSIPEDAHPRAILESQFLSVRSRIQAILPANAPHLKRLLITGGSSANTTIRQLAADCFGMKVYVAEGGKEAAAIGGALLAKYAWWRQANGGMGTFEEMIVSDMERMRLVAEPRPEMTKIYNKLVVMYKECEDKVVEICA